MILRHLFPTVANQPTCQVCFGNLDSIDTVAQCNSEFSSLPCYQNTFPNIGTTHCYKAEPIVKFQGSEDNFTGILKGCINCTGKLKEYHCI